MEGGGGRFFHDQSFPLIPIGTLCCTHRYPCRYEQRCQSRASFGDL